MLKCHDYSDYIYGHIISRILVLLLYLEIYELSKKGSSEINSDHI